MIFGWRFLWWAGHLSPYNYFYPDYFNGCWSYCPDPVDFNHLGLVNIYEDENMFYSNEGYLRPDLRTIHGQPQESVKQIITREIKDIPIRMLPQVKFMVLIWQISVLRELIDCQNL